MCLKEEDGHRLIGKGFNRMARESELVLCSEMDWDVYWCERDWMFEVFDHAQLESWQKVNHFR